VCLTVKPVGEPDALIGHVGFDERGWERSVAEWPKLPRPSSTLPFWLWAACKPLLEQANIDSMHHDALPDWAGTVN
jgi:hypothetical protein